MIITQKDIREVAGVKKTKIEVEVPGVIRVITQEEIEERKKQEIKEILPLGMAVEWLTEQKEWGIYEIEKVK